MLNELSWGRTLMKNSIILVLALFFFSTASFAITIDFESVSPGDVSGPDLEGNKYFETDGFGFYSQWGISNDGSNQSVRGFTLDGVFAPIAEVKFSRTDGEAFALHSLDILSCYEDFGFVCYITGLKTGGGVVNTSNVADLGSGDWLNLQYVIITNDGPAYSGRVIVDNIAVGAAVPVPAAVWLFGSALAGLGWIRRKQPGH